MRISATACPTPVVTDGRIDCKRHGRSASAIVCRHHLDARGRTVGFIENRSDPDDLQAWCLACEERYLAEGDLTEAFRAFNDFAVVCVACYREFERRHAAPSA